MFNLQSDAKNVMKVFLGNSLMNKTTISVK